jgi:hypothetical protein
MMDLPTADEIARIFYARMHQGEMSNPPPFDDFIPALRIRYLAAAEEVRAKMAEQSPKGPSIRSLDALVVKSVEECRLGAQAIIDLAMQRSGALIDRLKIRNAEAKGGQPRHHPVSAERRDNFARQGAVGAIMEAYLILTVEELATYAPEHAQAIANARGAILTSNIMSRVNEARAAKEAEHG